MKFETFAPLFPGFYNTVFQYDSEQDDIESYNSEYGTAFDYEDFDWDYKDYEERVSKKFVNRLESELKHFLPIKIKYQNLYSPKEYNFANDSINIEVSLSLPRLIKLIKDRKEDSAQYFHDKYTSCSGFISFHSNDIEDWLNKEYILENPKHRVGALLDCLCSIEIDNDDIYYWCDDQFYISFTQKEQA